MGGGLEGSASKRGVGRIIDFRGQTVPQIPENEFGNCRRKRSGCFCWSFFFPQR